MLQDMQKCRRLLFDLIINCIQIADELPNRFLLAREKGSQRCLR